MLKKTILSLAVGVGLLVLSGLRASADSPWKDYSYPEFGISLKSPLPIKDASPSGDDLKKMNAQGVLKVLTAGGSDGKGLIVVVTGSHCSMNMETKQLDGAVDGFIESLKSNFPTVSHQDKKFLYQGFPAIWTTGNMDGDKNTIKLLCLSVAKGGYLWMAAVIYPNSAAHEKVAMAFVNSVKLKVPNP